MKTSVFFLAFTAINIVGCNVAKQTDLPVEEVPIFYSEIYFGFTNPGANVYEGQTVEMHLTRPTELLEEPAYAFLLVGGDADSSDYTLTVDGVPATLSGGYLQVYFAPGKSLARIALSFNDDSTYELNERLSFTVSKELSGANSAKGYQQFVFNLINDDPLPSMSFTLSSSTVVEGVAKTVSLELSNPSYLETKGIVKIIGGSALSTDHDFSESFVTVPAGATSASVDILAIYDLYNELDETLELQVFPSVGLAPTETSDTHTLTITESLADPSYQFTLATDTVTEGSSITVQLDFTGTFDSELTIPIAVSGTAKNGTDFIMSEEYATLALGDSSATIDIEAVEDSFFEESETITLTIEDQDFALALGNTTMTITLADNEALPDVSFASSTYYSSEGAIIYVPLKLSAVSGEDLTVTYDASLGSAVAGADFIDPAGGSVTIPAGHTLKQIPIMITNDSLYEGTETLVLSITGATFPTLTAPSTAVATTTVNISETNTQPTIAFADAEQSVSETAGSADLFFLLDKPSEIPLTFYLSVSGEASSGDDYSLALGPHTIPAGSVSHTVSVTLFDDLDIEYRESLIVSIIQPSKMQVGGQNQHQLFIESDE